MLQVIGYLMNPHKMRWMSLLLVGLLLFGAGRLYYRLTDDFRLANIQYTLPFEAPWKTDDLTFEESQALALIFEQSFFYIGKGSQCYAFASEDGQYVLKFFKFKHLKPSLMVDLLPPIPPFRAFKQNCCERKIRKLISLFSGYDLAYRQNRQQSGLLYLHLTPTHYLHLTATVVDKIGIKRKIDLDEVIFLVQRKGETLRDRLRTLLDQGNINEAKQTLADIMTMYVSEYKKGLFDHDHGVMHNTGFIGPIPFHLDVGKFKKDERFKQPAIYQQDLKLVVCKINAWIQKSYPQYYLVLSHFLEQEYQAQIAET